MGGEREVRLVRERERLGEHGEREREVRLVWERAER